MQLRWFVYTALVSTLAGCGASSAESESNDVSAECRAMADTCFAEQRVCVGSGSSARCESCDSGAYPLSGTECGPLEGLRHRHDFGTVSLEPGEEHDGICRSWTLNNDDEIWFRSVELENDGGYHHSNWFFVPDNLWDLPDGEWSCNDEEFNEAYAAFRGGTLYAQTTQIRHQVQRFPEGVGIRIPPRSRIIGATHVFNTSAEPIETRLELSIYEVDAAAVDTPLHSFRLNISDIVIPPMSETSLTGKCDFDTAQATKTGEPLSMELYYALPHYHALGTGFRLEKLGGPDDGELIFDLESPEPRGHVFDAPVDMAGTSGFRFTCRYRNPRTEPVSYGIGDQEMCVMLGFARSTVLYDGNVTQSVPIDGSEGQARYSGDCEVIAAAM